MPPIKPWVWPNVEAGLSLRPTGLDARRSPGFAGVLLALESSGPCGSPRGLVGVLWAFWESTGPRGSPGGLVGVLGASWESFGPRGSPLGLLGVYWASWESFAPRGSPGGLVGVLGPARCTR
ncbi:hypothetical protein EYF80_044934 [Liparis tanakae]|uniref:Uncharacterized protein n=1 Tax=Liparis tanakae TaxID=230148 RepID=A0A4Z2FWA7_9TELE|nr:hypothetical protein EYF80_044934 [Liparis tanakae]